MTIHRFTPPGDAHETVLAVAGQVEVLELIREAVHTGRGVFPLYRVRNLATGREAFAFGDELTTTEE